MRDHLLVPPLIARVFADEQLLWSWRSGLALRSDIERREESPQKAHQAAEAFFTPTPRSREAGQNPSPLQTPSPVHERRMPRMWASVPTVVRGRGQGPGEQRQFTGPHRRQHCLPPPPHGGRQARHAQHDQDEAESDRDYQRFQTSSIGWLAASTSASTTTPREMCPSAGRRQLYGFAEVSNRKQLSKLLRDTFKKTRKVKRPVQTEVCDGSYRAISYGYKNDFVRRIGYRGQAGPPENRRTCWKTRKVSLRPIRACSSDALAAQDRICWVDCSSAACV